MAYNWRDNLTLAQELASRNDEAALRCLIGRAYYAVYGVARRHWEGTQRFIPPGVNTHYWLWSQYKQGRALERFIGQDGATLLQWRNQADYEDEVADLQDLASRSLVIAAKTLANLDKL